MFLQHTRALVHRGARGEHVIHEHNHTIGQHVIDLSSGHERSQRERLSNVPLPLGGGEPCLLRGRAPAEEHVRDWPMQVLRELDGLIESALRTLPRMQRHWNDAVRILQDIGARNFHQATQGASQRTATVVLQCVNDVSECRVIIADSASAIERVVNDKIAGLKQAHVVPAACADGTGQRLVEDARARNTLRRKSNRQHRVGGLGY
jgi:hypothetical protein